MKWPFTIAAWTLIFLLYATFIAPDPLDKAVKSAITADTDCLHEYRFIPIWVIECESIKSERIAKN